MGWMCTCERVDAWRDVDGGVVLGGHNQESTGEVLLKADAGADIGRLVIGLHDIIVGQGMAGEYVGGIE